MTPTERIQYNHGCVRRNLELARIIEQERCDISWFRTPLYALSDYAERRKRGEVPEDQ